MSKTIGSILAIGAAILVNVIPGVGQVLSAAITTAITSVGIGAALSLVASLFESSPRPPQTESAIKSPIPARISGYGRNRLHQAYALFVTASDGTAIDVGAFHDGRIDGIEGYYLADTKIVLQGNGFVHAGDGNQFGSSSDKVQIYTRLGLPTETAFSQVIAKVPDQWTTSHRGDGVVTACVLSTPVSAKAYQEVYPTGGPNQMPLSMVMRLQPVFDWRDPSQNADDPTTWKWAGSSNAVLALAHYLMVRDNYDWATHFAPTLAYWTAAANDCDSASPLKGVQAVLNVKGNRGDGSLALSTVDGLVTGTRIAISATGDTSLSESRTVTSISALTVGLDTGLSNNHPLGSQVTWLGSGASEPRYQTCVVHKHTDAHKDVKGNLLACFDGWLAPRSDGALIVYSGRYYAPTVTIGPDEIVSYSLQEGVDEEAAVNQIAVTYVSANHDYNTVDTDAWEDEDDIAARGKVLADSLSDQVPSFSQARRLAKRKMARINAPQRGTTTTNSRGRSVIGQRFINQNLVDAGVTFSSRVIEITKLVRNLTTGGVTYEWVAADPNVDEWNPATEEGLPAPVGNRIATAPLDPPVITASEVDFGSQSGDGVSGAFLRLTVASDDRSDLTWFARTREVGAAVWGERQYNDLAPGASVQIDTEFVPTDTMVEAEVAYSTGDGRVSDWSTSVTVDTHADLVVPDAAGTPTLSIWGGTLALNLPVNIARARSYRWRIYKADGTTLVATVNTDSRSLAYTAGQAARDGVQRAYVVAVAGVNAAGEGAIGTSAALTNPAPAAVTTPAIAGGATSATATCDASTATDLGGYVVFYSSTSGFDPATSGGVVTSGVPSITIFGLAAGTYYGRIAAYDTWSANPAALNLSSEISFTISTGGGSTPSGGGSDGGGYVGGGRPGEAIP